MERKQELIQNNQCFIEFGILTKNDIIQVQASWAKMTSPGDKLKALACQLTKKVNKAEELTYISTNIAWLTKSR
jgi:copper(I)-binding protein